MKVPSLSIGMIAIVMSTAATARANCPPDSLFTAPESYRIGQGDL